MRGRLPAISYCDIMCQKLIVIDILTYKCYCRTKVTNHVFIYEMCYLCYQNVK